MISRHEAKAMADAQFMREMLYPEHTYFSLNFTVHGWTFTFLRLYSRIDELRFSLLEVKR